MLTCLNIFSLLFQPLDVALRQCCHDCVHHNCAFVCLGISTDSGCCCLAQKESPFSPFFSLLWRVLVVLDDCVTVDCVYRRSWLLVGWLSIPLDTDIWILPASSSSTSQCSSVCFQSERKSVCFHDCAGGWTLIDPIADDNTRGGDSSKTKQAFRHKIWSP